jgi:hypothetical protein
MKAAWLRIAGDSLTVVTLERGEGLLTNPLTNRTFIWRVARREWLGRAMELAGLEQAISCVRSVPISFCARRQRVVA